VAQQFVVNKMTAASFLSDVSVKGIKFFKLDLFTDTAAILDPIVSDIYYGMLRGQIHTNLPPEHPIITI